MIALAAISFARLAGAQAPPSTHDPNAPRAPSSEATTNADAATTQAGAATQPNQTTPTTMTDTAAATSTPPAAPNQTYLDPVLRRDPSWYRGRRNYTTAGEGLRWIPRVLFFPVYAVNEYVIRRPTYAVVTWSERNRVPPWVVHVFHPTPDIVWSPMVAFDLGTLASIGSRFEWRNALVQGHTFASSMDFGGVDFFRANAEDRWRFGSFYFGARGQYLTRPDRPFYGLGPRSGNVRTNFRQTEFQGFGFVGAEYQNYLRVELSGGFRGENLGPGYSPSIETLFPIQTIPGFYDARLLMGRLSFRVDTRRVLEQNTGAFLHAIGILGHDVQDERVTYASVAANAEGAVEVWKPDRVITGRVYFMDTFALGSEPVPFMELAMLGWNNHLGFLWGRFRGDAAVLAELRYRYPIAYYVDMQWITSVGNVFARDFSDFSVGALTGSFGVGLRTRRTGFANFEGVLAFGTSRFEDSFAIDSVRLYVGTTTDL